MIAPRRRGVVLIAPETRDELLELLERIDAASGGADIRSWLVIRRNAARLLPIVRETLR